MDGFCYLGEGVDLYTQHLSPRPARASSAHIILVLFKDKNNSGETHPASHPRISITDPSQSTAEVWSPCTIARWGGGRRHRQLHPRVYNLDCKTPSPFAFSSPLTPDPRRRR